MRLIHDGSVVASEVELADTRFAQARGLMFRRSIPGDYALVFPFDRAASRWIHMLFVPFPIDVVWVVGERVERASRLRPWLGVAVARADTVIELPAGAADGIDPGDTVRVEGGATE